MRKHDSLKRILRNGAPMSHRPARRAAEVPLVSMGVIVPLSPAFAHGPAAPLVMRAKEHDFAWSPVARLAPGLGRTLGP